MQKMVSIIIVNWNGIAYIRQCLNSLGKQDYKNVEIIIVDNGSTDGSQVYVKKEYPYITLIQNIRNEGFAEGNNIGFRAAKGEYILFLNNDTTVTETFLSALVVRIESDEKIGCVQSKIFVMHEDRLDAVAAYLTPVGLLYYFGINKKDAEKYGKFLHMYSAKGACMLFRKKVLDEIIVDNEILDGRFFAYFEETDMCHRTWLRGYSVVYEPKSVIYHKGGGTSTKMDNTFLQYHSFKNRINTYCKNFSLKYLIQILPVHIFLCEVFAFLAFFTLRFKLFLAIQNALIWNIIQVPTTLRKRKYIQQKIRILPDDAFFPIIMKKPPLAYYFGLFSGLKNYED